MMIKYMVTIHSSERVHKIKPTKNLFSTGEFAILCGVEKANTFSDCVLIYL